MKLIIDGNTKMGRDVAVFNLPPKKTCHPTKWCLFGRDGLPMCYALRNNFLLPNVLQSLQKRYKLSLTERFVSDMIDEIRKSNYRFFRIHSSGDFYSENYVAKWIEIAKNCPHVLFRSTTRRRDLTKSILKLHKLPNVIIRESLDDTTPKPIMGLPFTALSHMPIAKGVFKCMNNCDKCGHRCWKRAVNMCFDEH